MNNLLQLKGQFQHKRAPKPGPVELPAGAAITSEKLRSLSDDLHTIKEFWVNKGIPFDPLVSVYYRSVVAKSNRIHKLLSATKSSFDSVVGAEFAGTEQGPKHVITHCVDMSTINQTIALLEHCATILDDNFGGFIDHDTLSNVNSKDERLSVAGLSRSAFAQCMRDAFFVERFGIKDAPGSIDGDAVVTLYDTGYKNDIVGFLHQLGIVITPDRVLGSAVRLNPEEYARLIARYPFLVSMAVKDLNEIEAENYPSDIHEESQIPRPGHEPVIGVIDTAFDDRVYFSSWVEVPESPYVLPPDQIEPKDRVHGTAVSSLIVDGPHINPELDDGCGRFRVRHFAVAKAGRFSSFAVMRSIQGIVRSNRDIKVWNISLGSPASVSRNFISPEAAVLDDLQSEFNDIVFIVAGTNKENDLSPEIIGAPADSINSIVVNATDFNGAIASYSRRGPVLSFFKKPDVCCVGGDSDRGMHICTPTGESWRPGTSFAAPWIARKMAYLMQVMNLPREVAKALLIDSAAGWTFEDNPYTGYGRVPQNINDVLDAADDEIRFLLTGTSEDYETYSYGIPVPIHNGTHPYIARATMCYFPKCDRRQGVDYTSTEMDLHFGRINDKGRIQPLNKNPQGEKGALLYEKDARALYRKWDNVKHVGELLTPSIRPRKTYSTGLWGIKVRTTERTDQKNGRGMNFGIVVTLKEINGVNRIDDFIHQCSLRGWIVSRVDVKNRIDIYNAAEVDIDFDE